MSSDSSGQQVMQPAAETSNEAVTHRETGDPAQAQAPGPSDSSAGHELMPFDDGSVAAGKAQSSAMSLVINFADPAISASTAVFGLGLLVLPLLARLNGVGDQIFSYETHGEANREQKMRFFTESELRQRLGNVDPFFLKKDLVLDSDSLEDYVESQSPDVIDSEVSKLQRWREVANANLRSFQKRSALVFLGLPPDATDADIGKMYKKMALELHPDKGGDPEKFQELQEMKERLNDIEDEDKKNDEDKSEDEEREAAEREKEEKDGKKLTKDERAKKLRMDTHDTVCRLWERAKKSTDEILGKQSGTKKITNAAPALTMLRAFVDRFVNTEVRRLRHGDTKGADAGFRKFVKQGAEIIAVAALHDVQSTLQTISMQFNYRLVARSGSPEVHANCQALLAAIADVPEQSEAFIKSISDALAESQSARRERANKPDQPDGTEADVVAQQSKAEATTQAAPTATTAATAKGESAPDPFADFDFEAASGRQQIPKCKPVPEAAQAPTRETDEALAQRGVDRRLVAKEPQRTAWDPNFDHPYAGALKGNGSGIFCRPCQRWITTYEYDIGVFLTHAERVHPRPPMDWHR